MADYRDVMHARHEADSARASLDTYAGKIEDGVWEDNGLGLAIGLSALCLEVRALATALENEIGQLTQATGRF